MVSNDYIAGTIIKIISLFWIFATYDYNTFVITKTNIKCIFIYSIYNRLLLNIL